jgi:transposase InsO family protein
MTTRIHPQARTTPKIRQEIKDSGLSDRQAATVFNISRATAAKWLRRDDTQDRSHRALTQKATLTPPQEAVVLSLRETLYLPLDDLLYITKQYINPDVSRSGVARLLKRHYMSKLADVIPKAETETAPPKKTFKSYEPGFIHIDIKYLPQMADESSRRYLFVAIDRATRWVFLHTYADMTDVSSVDFLRRLKLASPIKITKILTDNGSQFTDRFTSKNKKPTGKHAFDLACASIAVEHRLAPPRHPQTNGMVERFNGRISELIRQTHFASAAELEATLQNYWKLYNHHIPQRAIDGNTPIQALKEWQQKKPELFAKRVYDRTELDMLLHQFAYLSNLL